MSSEQQEVPPQESPQPSDQSRQSEEDASRIEIQSLKNQIEDLQRDKENLLNQKNQEIENLNTKIRELTTSLEQLQAANEDLNTQMHQKNSEIEGLHARIREATVGFSDLQALETIFNETNQDVINSISGANLSLVAIKQRINEQVRATFVEKHNIEIEAMKAHCGNSVEQCRGKINGFEGQITAIMNIMTDEFGAYDEQHRTMAVAPARAKKEEQEVLQGNFSDLQNKLQGRVAQ